MPGRLGVALGNIDSIRAIVLQTKGIHIRLLLDSFNEYERFIKTFSRILRQLNDYLRKNKELDWSGHSTETLEASTTLKSGLVEPPV